MSISKEDRELLNQTLKLSELLQELIRQLLSFNVKLHQKLQDLKGNLEQ